MNEAFPYWSVTKNIDKPEEMLYTRVYLFHETSHFTLTLLRTTHESRVFVRLHEQIDEVSLWPLFHSVRPNDENIS